MNLGEGASVVHVNFSGNRRSKNYIGVLTEAHARHQMIELSKFVLSHILVESVSGHVVNLHFISWKVSD